jgi:hypothetical protein
MGSYSLNTDNARQVGVSTRISEKGAYVGTFTRAEEVAARSGATGIEFSFKTKDGQSADYLSLWATSGEGKPLYGRKVIDAIMTCMKVRQIASQPTNVKKRDKDGEHDVSVPCFRELMGREIGLMLVKEEYAKDDGSVGSKMVIVAPFCAGTKRTAAEVLDQAHEARSFDLMLASLRDRPLQASKTTQRRAAAAQHTNTGGGFDDMDDDIPF